MHEVSAGQDGTSKTRPNRILMPCPLMDWVAANSSSHRLLTADMGSKGSFKEKATLSGGFFVAPGGVQYLTGRLPPGGLQLYRYAPR